MNAVSASAPGKIILFGEHAVVYGQPALAVPVTQVRATATISPHPLPLREAPLWGSPKEGGVWIDARDVGRRYRLEDADATDPLAAAINLTLEEFTFHALRSMHSAPDWTITVESTIPIASGLGSGAAVCTAIVRTVAAHLGVSPTTAKISSIVFETEKLLHGTPSGIDNTVIAYEQPVYFVKGQPPEPFTVAWPFRLLIADTGLPSPTKTTVGDVRAAWQKQPERYEQIFHVIGDIVREAKVVIETSKVPETFEVLGELMNRNHQLLRELNVSSPELESLTEAARASGALGAKLSGGGRGGNMIALPALGTEERVIAALEKAGAKRVIATVIGHR